MSNVFGKKILKENHGQFYEKHLKRCVELSLKHSNILANDSFLEQEFENFNRKVVGSEEPLGDDDNGEEEQ